MGNPAKKSSKKLAAPIGLSARYALKAKGPCSCSFAPFILSPACQSVRTRSGAKDR